MTEVVVTTDATSRANLESNRHHQQPTPYFFTGRMPFLSPNQQRQSTEGKMMTMTTMMINMRCEQSSRTVDQWHTVCSQSATAAY